MLLDSWILSLRSCLCGVLRVPRACVAFLRVLRDWLWNHHHPDQRKIGLYFCQHFADMMMKRIHTQQPIQNHATVQACKVMKYDFIITEPSQSRLRS